MGVLAVAALSFAPAKDHNGATASKSVSDRSSGERTLPFPSVFRDDPAPCPYLPGQDRAEGVHRADRAARRRPQRRARPDRFPPQPGRRLPAELHRLPACVSVRVVAGEFEPSATQRKMIRRYADLEVTACKPWTTEEQYALLRRYLHARHPAGGMVDMDESDFSDMVEQSPVKTYVVEYREPSVDGRPGQARRRVPDRPAGRRPVDDLQLLRARRSPRGRASAPTSSSTISSAPGARGCPMSISAIGSRNRGRMAYKAKLPPAASGSAPTAGAASSPNRKSCRSPVRKAL